MSSSNEHCKANESSRTWPHEPRCRRRTSDPLFPSLPALVRFVESFEACTLPRDQWTHQARLVVTAWYLIHFEESEAIQRSVAGIQRYNRVQGIRLTRRRGYHETLTLFWLAIVREFLNGERSGATALEKINALASVYGGAEHLYRKYYSDERIFSWKARLSWVDPDLRHLDRS